MTNDVEILIPIIDKSLSKDEDWQSLIDYARSKIKSVRKMSDAEYYTEKYLKDLLEIEEKRKARKRIQKLKTA